MPESTNKDIKIVIADDEAVVLSLVRDALEEEGYEVAGALNGQDALDLIRSQLPHLIITDIRMPRMNGIELARRARELRPGVVVIFMTAYADLNSAKEAISQGAFEYIMKPFELTEIRQAVQKAVARIRKEASDRGPDEKLERLSDLNQMLYTAGDRKSLAILTLRFAIVHLEARCGAFLYWNSLGGNVRLISIEGNRTDEHLLDEEPVCQCLSRLDPSSVAKPFHVTNWREHPFYLVDEDERLHPYLAAEQLCTAKCVFNVPVTRAEKLYGLLMIGLDTESPTMSEADSKFVSISASQLALSLENIALLEETQQAYARLKDLQDETIQLEKMAARGEMSAEIGHELNNFLGVVTANLSLLDHNLKKGKYDQVPRYMQSIAENVEKVRKFTSNLMDLAPISTAKEIIRFDQLIEEVVHYLRRQRRYRDVQIKLRPTPEPILFRADNVHIQQLLYNLFNNAADATEGCPRREINAYITVDHGQHTFCVTIADTGVGIDPAVLQKVFNERFTTKKTGHGFGLLVCKRVIDSHDGKLQVSSTPHEGTTICVTFPLAGRPESDSVEATAQIPIVATA